MAGRQKQLGEAHSDSLSSMQRYAELLQSKGQGEEAEELLNKIKYDIIII